MALDVLPGRVYPVGATVTDDGVNFSVFSRNAEMVELVLFDGVDDASPSHVVPLRPERHRTFHYWHALIRGVRPGQLYGYRAHGPYSPARGLLFDASKLLLDPYARCVAYGAGYDREAAIVPGSNADKTFKSVVVDLRAYDWDGDVPLERPFANTVIYELHVGGLTHHPSSGLAPELRGTYAGLIEKIPYLEALGVTAVELMPVQQFDPQDAPAGLVNYWGYAPVAFFAPHRGYSSRTDPLGPVDEFRDMVKALHRAGIEVILDVVFNHTSEGGKDGPTFSLRGLENQDYYLLHPRDPSRYRDYSGCGNTLNANRAIVRRMIRDALRYWVEEMHVDGFRFDLASVHARDDQGEPMRNPPLLWDIEYDPVLAGTKIIAEAWDAGGLYQVGSFVGHRWAEWNGRFRDDIRRFLRGDRGFARAFAHAVTGSRDIYPEAARDPSRSIHFVTCHDGFTLNDLVSYERKHNADNREANRDGMSHNYSHNFGVEGPTDDLAIDALREQQIKNFFTVLLVAQGTPMLSMGDEVRRTQRGNNNAYCHDSELVWFDWEGLERHRGLLRFVRELIAFVQARPLFARERFWSDTPDGGHPIITWHGVTVGEPDWADWSHSVAFSLRDDASAEAIHVMVNAWSKPLAFELPALERGRLWHAVIDTALPSPLDIRHIDHAPAIQGTDVAVQARSIVLACAGKAQRRRPSSLP
jgi:glycogen operon protein